MYKYHFRPEYKSDKLLIEIFTGVENEEFISDFFEAIKELNPEISNLKDLWMNDEFLLLVNSEMGEFIFSKDIWDLSFLMAENNQECLYKINSLLEISGKFTKQEVDFEDCKEK